MPIQQNPGTSRAVQQALQRRQNAGALNQMSPQAAQPNPVPVPATQSSLNKASAPSDRPPQQTQKFQAQNQEDLIIEALVEQLNNIQEAKKDKAKMTQGQPALQSQPVPQEQSTGGAYEAVGGCKKNRGGASNFNYSGGFEQPITAHVATMNQQPEYYSGIYSGLNNYNQGNDFESELNKFY
jgi:hypothetical protein